MIFDADPNVLSSNLCSLQVYIQEFGISLSSKTWQTSSQPAKPTFEIVRFVYRALKSKREQVGKSSRGGRPERSTLEVDLHGSRTTTVDRGGFWQ